MLAQPRHVRVGLTADQAPDLMSLREQMLGEVRAVLPGDAGDECSPGQRILLAVSVARGLAAGRAPR
ncbi:hypothetical protein Acsp04_42040 [Actinomadura sp. NBRC 104425]|nr:hypothetical protein Acsp04_42040 [Actinomadura sp. NBRC 104425]